jgi:hypothetical protein
VPDRAVTWASLGTAARAFRFAHALFAVLQLASLGYLWLCAMTGRRDRGLNAGVGALLVEGAALVVGRGDCPMGPFQRQLGDPMPMFEWVLAPRAAKAAIPMLTALSVAGLLALVARGPADR